MFQDYKSKSLKTKLCSKENFCCGLASNCCNQFNSSCHVQLFRCFFSTKLIALLLRYYSLSHGRIISSEGVTSSWSDRLCLHVRKICSVWWRKKRGGGWGFCWDKVAQLQQICRTWQNIVSATTAHSVARRANVTAWQLTAIMLFPALNYPVTGNANVIVVLLKNWLDLLEQE